MRTRTRELNLLPSSSLAAGHYALSWTNCDGSGDTDGNREHPAHDSVPTLRVREMMQDTTGNREGSNGCFHRSEQRTCRIIGSCATGVKSNDTPDGKFGTHYYSGGGIALRGLQLAEAAVSALGQWDYSPEAGRSLPPGLQFGRQGKLDSVLIEDCFEAARGLKADVLLNLIEGRELYPALQSSAMSLRKLAQNWRLIRRYVGSSSGAYLMWRFGISPLVSDMKRAVSSLEPLKKDLKRWADGEVYRYSSKTFMDLISDEAGPQRSGHAYISVTGSGGLYRNLRWETSEPCTIRYVLRIRPSAAVLDSLFRDLDRVYTTYASSLSSIAWELVPWSFVVDWFVDMRGLLRRLDDVLGKSPYEIVGFTRSVSFDAVKHLDLNERSACSGAVLWSEDDVASAKYRYYERLPAATQATMPAWSPRFGNNQARITAALIGQQLAAAKLARGLGRIFL